MTFFGEGSTANGQWHEAMNFAGVHRLPVVFVLENNKFAYSTPNELEFAVDPFERAAGYGFPGVSVDGNDVEAVFEAAREAAERAREGGGPTLIECHTMRMHGHGAHDDMSYVPAGAVRGVGGSATRSSATAARLADEHGFAEDELDADRDRGRARGGRGGRAGARVADARPRARHATASSPIASSRSATGRPPGRAGARMRAATARTGGRRA